MRHPEAGQLFTSPYCRKAEVSYWYDLLDRFGMKQHGLAIPECRVCLVDEKDDENTPQVGVIWKREKFDVLTGLCINGPYAGHLVAGYEPDEVPHVRVHRTITRDGGYFSVERALEHLVDLDIPSPFKKILQRKLSGWNVSYPHVLSTLIEWLEYPIDKKTFIRNIAKADLHASLG